MMSVNRLSAWLGNIPRDTEEFVLVHLTGEDTEQVVASYPRYDPSKMSHEQFADSVLAEIQSNCDDNECVSRYSIRATCKGRTLGSRTIRAVPSAAIPDPLQINSSSIAGNTAIQQLVRMNECALRLLVQSWGSVMTGYKSLLTDQRSEIDSLRKRETELANNILVQIAKQAEIDEGEVRQSVAVEKLSNLIEKYVPQIINNFPHENNDLD